jgi:hypothetical protein
MNIPQSPSGERLMVEQGSSTAQALMRLHCYEAIKVRLWDGFGLPEVVSYTNRRRLVFEMLPLASDLRRRCNPPILVARSPTNLEPARLSCHIFATPYRLCKRLVRSATLPNGNSVDFLPSSIVRLEVRETGEERPELVGEDDRWAPTGSRLISTSVCT